MYKVKNYSRTSAQQPPQGQRKVAVEEGRPTQGEVGVQYETCFLGGASSNLRLEQCVHYTV